MDAFEIAVWIAIYLFSCMMWFVISYENAEDTDRKLSQRKKYLTYTKLSMFGPFCWIILFMSYALRSIRKGVSEYYKMSRDIEYGLVEEAEVIRQKKLDDAAREIEKMKKEDADEWWRQFNS